MKREPRRTLWINLGRGRYAFVKVNVIDTQLWIPKYVAEKGKQLRAVVFDAEEQKIFEDELHLYACNENGCKARLSRIFMGKKLIVGVI